MAKKSFVKNPERVRVLDSLLAENRFSPSEIVAEMDKRGFKVAINYVYNRKSAIKGSSHPKPPVVAPAKAAKPKQRKVARKPKADAVNEFAHGKLDEDRLRLALEIELLKKENQKLRAVVAALL